MCLSFLLCKAGVLVLALLIHMNGAISSSSTSAADHFALLKIKSKITNDPQGVLRYWNDSLPFCQWHGLKCGRRHQRVTSLDLSATSIKGSLSPYIGNLSFLRYINFENNQLYGTIPQEIGHLFRLQMLLLANNSFVGEIPTNISSCSKLWYIRLSRNMFSGKIPNIFGSLKMIKHLFLNKNSFTGGIPPSIGNLTNLEQLSLSECPLGGSIPSSFNQLNNLRKIGLGKNDLVGAFPSFFFNLSRLELLNFPQNELHGSLPSNLCLNQPRLKKLEMMLNYFNGPLPPSISNCSELETLDVTQNNFTGEIAIDFGKLQHLIAIFLSSNRFESKGPNGMKFFDSLSNCSKLEALFFLDIQLSGTLPDSIGNFSSTFQYIALNSNHISGCVPSSIGNLVGLTNLELSENNFTCMIPESIGHLRNLEELYLDNNAFSGIIPKSIGNLSLLTELVLGRNKLEGTIPSTIANCTKLILLNVSRNNLNGSVPKELFQLSSLSILLDLSQNNLSGTLPQNIGNLKVLAAIDLSKNHLSGELPSSFSSLISLQTVKLSRNYFHGSMPEAWSSLRGLEYVDLSRNNFSGHIPTYMQEIDLKLLDLSYNDFEGEVSTKGVFANISAILVAENYRLCGGIPELHLPKCKTTNSRKSRKLSLSVVVAISLSSIVAACLSLVSCFFLFYYNKHNKRDKPSESILINSLEKVSYGKLFKATEGFSSANLIGTGSFSWVYRGVLDESGLIVAIKVLNLHCRGGSKSFMAECDVLRTIRHRNLVKVITCCSSLDFQGNDFKALVYEFMPNGSLETWLHSSTKFHLPHDHEVCKLDLVRRISIAKDVACALEYLHCHSGNVVVHCDLKPNNILLDDDMVAHVGDFGLAKILSLDEVSNANKISSSVIRGTIGYTPPEYGLGNEVSRSGDIYSFGILLLEMTTGKKPIDPMFSELLSLHSYARTALANGFVLHIVDPMLLNDGFNETSLNLLLKIGVECSYESPKDRIDIGTVIHELVSIDNGQN